MAEKTKPRAVAEICTAIGLDPSQVYSLALELAVENVVTITAGFYPHITDEQFTAIAEKLADANTHVQVNLVIDRNGQRMDIDADPD